MKILLVEDEAFLREGLEDLLRGAGHEVVSVGDGHAAIRWGLAEAFDLVLLDLMLPGRDGLEVCDRLRTARPGLPVIMLTARGSEDDKVEGLRRGADDYVTKPFSPRELLARVDALGRRTQGAPAGAERLVADGCELDLGRCEARRGDAVQPLTAREAGILRWLHRHGDRAVSRAELLRNVWGLPGTLETRTVDMAIANLRRKIERDPSRPRIVVSVKGVGYAWGRS
jgi:DNA-binding response OmpR family regulator